MQDNKQPKPRKATKPNKRKELTIKERKFVNDLIKTGNQTDAYINNYDTNKRTVAASNGSTLVKRENIRNAIQAELRKQNIDKEMITNRLKELANQSDSLPTSLNTIKYILTLLGYNEDTNTNTKGNINITIDKGVIPVNITKDNNNNLDL